MTRDPLTSQWTTGGWEECAGYDCITPGVNILCVGENSGEKILVVDAADHGWSQTGLGSGVVAHREAVRAKVIEIADSIVRLHNKALA